MSWIRVIEESLASDELEKVYDRIKQKRGKLSNIMKVQSLKPGTMMAHLELYMSIMFNESRLKREIKEMIAVTVSQLNGCRYCVHHHMQALNHYWKDSDRVSRFAENYESVNLSSDKMSILQYVNQLTLRPSSISEKDVDSLRKASLQDEEILEINLIVSYFNFVNRIASGLGVSFSPEEMRGYKY